MIRKFADPQHINFDREEQMKYLHLEMLKKYQRECEKNWQLGEQALKKEFLRKVNAI